MVIIICLLPRRGPLLLTHALVLESFSTEIKICCPRSRSLSQLYGKTWNNSCGILPQCVMEKRPKMIHAWWKKIKSSVSVLVFCGSVTENTQCEPSLPPGERGWQRHLCVQLSEGGDAPLPSSQEEKGPSRGQWEPEGLEWEQQGPAAENPELRERTGKTWRAGAPCNWPFREPQNVNVSPNIGAHQTSRRWENLTWLWGFSDFCSGNSKKPELTVI